MERNIEMMLSSNSALYLSTLLAAALFFLMVAIREVKKEHYEGFMYFPLALFFGAVHGFVLWYLPIDSPMATVMARFTVWNWAIYILAPALIMLFIVLGIFNFLRIDTRSAMVKIFFGLTLLCYMFMLGMDWAPDVKGIITLLYCWAWFEVEIGMAT
ncbi:MAG: hypothetical protein AB1483_03280 [Candidatus Zixiibacteriota bacterium]